MEALRKLGFSPSEIKIYLYLLIKGPSYANNISSGTKINRTNVYEALDRLQTKGVVSSIARNKVKWFEAKEPGSIETIITEKQEELLQIKNSLKELKGIKSEKSLEANVFIGKKGLRMLFEDILEMKSPISILAAELQFKQLFGPYFKLWHKKRMALGIKQRSIFPSKFKDKLEKMALLKYKFVDNINPTTTIIYGDNCIFVQWSTEPIAIKINNKDISKSHQNYFDILWNS